MGLLLNRRVDFGWWPHELASVEDYRAADYLVGQVDVEVVLLADGEKELGDVVGVEGAGLGGETTR